MRIVRTILNVALLAYTPTLPEFKVPVVNSVLTRFFSTESDAIIPITITKAINSLYKISVTLYDLSDNKLYERTYTANDMGGVSLPVNFDLVLPFKDYLTPNGLKVELVYKNSKNVLETQMVTVYPYSKKSINVTAYKKEDYVDKGNYIQILEMKMFSDETYSFKDLNEYIALGENSKLELNSICFTYDSPFNFACSEVYLKIKDYQNVFPNLQDENKDVILRMKYTQNNKIISLSLNEDLYVNQDTLEMSRVKLPNTVKTNDIFVSLGKEELLYDDDISINIKNAGVSYTDFYMPFSYYLNKKYVGQCYESDYCITGGIKQ